MLVLFETPAGYAIFKLLDEKKLQSADNLYLDFESPEGASKVVKLKHFQKFKDTTEALAAATAAVEGKMSKTLKKMLKKLVAQDIQDQLAVADAKLGNSIKDKMNMSCVSSSAVQELMRCIRGQMDSLITGLPQRELSAMALGLAHSLSRYKLKFSPDKVDTMIVQAISLLDDLDKELNNYVMRCREWYGWHFPELGKIVQDNMAYAKTVKLMGDRTNAANCDFSPILPEEIEAELKEAAEVSMGTEVSGDDINNIGDLCDQILEINDYRAQLYDYLKNRMMAIAPNLTILVGELVGARLIAHAGSLLNLAKHPSSTVQILGAEKALFRALKTKHDTPKYGLIYHASLVGQTNPKNKGKVSRMLAAKAALAIRVDALGEDSNTEMGVEHRAKLEARLRSLEEGGRSHIIFANPVAADDLEITKSQDISIHGSQLARTTFRQASCDSGARVTASPRHHLRQYLGRWSTREATEKACFKNRRISGTGKQTAKWEKYENKSEVKTYDPAADSTLPSLGKKRKHEAEEDGESKDEEFKPKKIKVEVKEEPQSDEEESSKKKKKKKKDKKRESEAVESSLDSTMDTTQEAETPSSEKKKKKKKKKIKEEAADSS